MSSPSRCADAPFTTSSIRSSLGRRPRTSRSRGAIRASLARSEAFYQSLVETLPQNFFRKDLGGRLTYANTRYCETIGRPFGELIGKLDVDYFPADIAAKYMADDRRVMTTGERLEMIETHPQPGGTLIYVQVIKTPIRDENGAIVGLQGIFWDVTERKVMENQLQHERELMQTLLDTCPDSIYFKDLESRFLKVNRRTALHLGLTDPADAIGRTDTDFFDVVHATDARADELRIISTGESVISKLELEETPGNDSAWVITTKLPLRDKSGTIIGTFGISRDVTALKRAEAEIAEARDEALASAQSKAEFLANMSHEIRTPLNAIVGMSDLLLDITVDEEQRDFAKTIQTSADLLLSIVNDILDFSKIEAGKLLIEEIEFDLGQVLEETADLLAERAQCKGVELAAFLAPGTPTLLRGDPSRIRQVLVNLLSNAIKFTERGEVVAKAEAVEESDTGPVVRFEVRDTGIGIPDEAQHRLFTAFTQADGSTTRRYGGTGLGLAISRNLVTLMGGHIGFDSSVGQGSTFWFTLPLAPVGVTPPSLSVSPALDDARVLIVDDNATNRQILERQTRAWRMRSDSACNGPDALARLRGAIAEGDPYRLVLLDMQMPDMDGMAIARAVKNDPALRETRIIVLTSMGHHLEESEQRMLGIDAYLTKPVKQIRLHGCVASTLSRTEARSIVSPALAEGCAAPPREGAATAGHLHVLMAEDNAINQKVALRQLARLGYRADVVANGVEALAALELRPYDVVLMDCQMPELDGYEATRRIRQIEAGRPSRLRLHIIALTAHAMDGDRAKCLAAGMDDYLSKPIRIEELAHAMQRGASTSSREATGGAIATST